MTKNKIISGLKMTMELFLFDPSTGETCEPDDLNELNRTTYDACKGAVELLENPEPHWIPVTERLPETNDEVLTTYIVNGDRSKRYVETSSYYQSSESWSSVWDEYRVAGTRIEVIAWMPLPEPFKGGVTE